MILEEYGGVYLDLDYHHERSLSPLHTLFDSYTGSEGIERTGVTTGIIGVRPQHPAMTAWRELVVEYYAYTRDKWGTSLLWPLPAFIQDIIHTSGPRALTASIWISLQHFW